MQTDMRIEKIIIYTNDINNSIALLSNDCVFKITDDVRHFSKFINECWS